MNNIKFRIWSKKFNCWKAKDSKSMTAVIGVRKEQEIFTLALSNNCNYCVQLSTGLKDSHGIDMYEGDILMLNKGMPYQSTYEVIWKEGGFSLISANRDGDEYGTFTRNIKAIDYDQPIIIGNIFENPELTK